MTEGFNPDVLPPCECANVKYLSSPHPETACQQFGKVYLQQAFPKKCYAAGEGLSIATPNQIATAVLHAVDSKGETVIVPIETVACELVSKVIGKSTDCSVKEVQASQYEISYQVTNRGRYQLSIKVEDEHIQGSPFAVRVRSLDKPVKVINDLKQPSYIVIDNKTDNAIISEAEGRCVSVYNPTGENTYSFVSEELQSPRGVALDCDGSILVVDGYLNRILKFTSNGNFITTVGKRIGEFFLLPQDLEYDSLVGAGIHPHSKKLYIADQSNHCIKILNSDLISYSTIGTLGSDSGQLKYPADIAFDSTVIRSMILVWYHAYYAYMGLL